MNAHTTLTEKQIAARKKWTRSVMVSCYVRANTAIRHGKLPNKPIHELSDAAKRGAIDGFRVALLHAKQRKQQAA